jgi:hypothetical protein
MGREMEDVAIVSETGNLALAVLSLQVSSVGTWLLAAYVY